MIPAEYFDIFGFIGFLILVIAGIWMLTSKKRVPFWMKLVILVIGIIGLIVDGYIVIKTFIIG